MPVVSLTEPEPRRRPRHFSHALITGGGLSTVTPVQVDDARVPGATTRGDQRGRSGSQTNYDMKKFLLPVLCAAASLAVLSGCMHKPNVPTQSGFLYSYASLVQVDPYTWRYINTNRLGIYKKFMVDPVKVKVTEFEGKKLTPEQLEKASKFVRDSVIKAISANYPVVDAPGVDVAEVRVAITSAYKKGLQVGFTLEGELLDSYTAFQAAGVVRSEIGDPYVGSWWDGPSFKHQVDEFSKRVGLMLGELAGK